MTLAENRRWPKAGASSAIGLAIDLANSRHKKLGTNLKNRREPNNDDQRLHQQQLWLRI
jgi:hypothetical protein